MPSPLSPDVMDGSVDTIYDAGTKILAGGTFTKAQNRDLDVDVARRYLLAFDKATGAVDTAFAPVLDGDVDSIIAGPTAGTAYIAGQFNTVNGVTRRKVALINVANGALVTTFAPPAFNGAVVDMVAVGGRLLVGGVFTTAGAANPRGGLASLNATTGKLDTYLTTTLTGNHNWNGSGAKAAGRPREPGLVAERDAARRHRQLQERRRRAARPGGQARPGRRRRDDRQLEHRPLHPALPLPVVRLVRPGCRLLA